MAPASNPTWAVALQRTEVPMESELAAAVADALATRGCPVSRVRDGDAAGFEAGVLLLLVNLANYPAYARRLSQSAGARPRTILWQMDPLPPAETPPLAEQAGLTAAAWRDRLGVVGVPQRGQTWFNRVLRARARFRQWSYKQLSSLGYRRALRVMLGAPGWRWHDLDWVQVRACFQGWHAIQRGVRERWLDHLCMSTRQRQHFLATRGIPSEFLPVPAYPALGRLLRLDRDIDVLFLGRVKHGRRRREWPRLRGALVARGIRTLGITGDCYGEHRTELVNRTRLLLNLQNYPWNPAWIRFHIATLCGAAVVSEPIDDDEPYARGHDYLAAPRADLLVAIEELLQDESARRRLVDNASRICQARLAVPAAIEQLRSLAT